MKTQHYVNINGNGACYLVTRYSEIWPNQKPVQRVVVDTIYDSAQDMIGHDAVVHWTRIGEWADKRGGDHWRAMYGEDWTTPSYVTRHYKARPQPLWTGKHWDSLIPGAGSLRAGGHTVIEWRRLAEGFHIEMGGWLMENGERVLQVR